MSREGRIPVFKTVATSVAFAGAAILFWVIAPADVPRSHTVILLLAFFAAVAAVIFAKGIGLGTAWLVLIALTTPALVLVPVYRPPVWVFPLAAFVLAGFFSNGALERVPLYLTNQRTKAQLAELLPAGERRAQPMFIDLGCGLGGVVAAVGRARPDATIIGVETAPLTFLMAWLRIALIGPRNATVQFRSVWKTDVSGADTVYAFLSPAPMKRLSDKLRSEMKPGAIFISNSFAVPGVEPDTVVGVDDGRRTQLLIWRM